MSNIFYKEEKGSVLNMVKSQWVLLANWVAENKHRVIFRTRKTGANLIDITIETLNIEEIINKVVNTAWTKQELIDYLNTQSKYQESAFKISGEMNEHSANLT